MGVSIVPGFDRDKKRLTQLLDRAAEITYSLKVSVSGGSLGQNLKDISDQLKDMLSHQLER